MKILPLLLAGLLSASTSFAYDSDPGYVVDPALEFRAGRGRAPAPAPEYFKPLQRYYGRGYVIAYRYAPVKGSGTIRTPDRYTLPAARLAGASGSAMRVTYRPGKPAPVRQAQPLMEHVAR